MSMKKAYTLQTETMSSDRLNMYNLDFNTTSVASDHFPKVTDFEIASYPLATNNTTQNSNISILSNPINNLLHFSYELPQNAKTIHLSLSNIYHIKVPYFILAKGSPHEGGNMINKVLAIIL